MPFEEVLKEIKYNGAVAMRECWDCKTIWLNPYTREIELEDDCIRLWIPCQEDILATDWELC